MIENTRGRDPLVHLAGSSGRDGLTGYVEGMEAAAQRQLVASDRLPTDCRSTDEELTALGFVLGDVDKADPMFRHVQLPDGWRREGSEHAMWSHLIDANGKKRASIFYKGAFYDRAAHWSLNGVHMYVYELLSDPKARVALDDEWATADAVSEALAAKRAHEEEQVRFWTEHRGADSEYAAESRATIARLDELVAQVPPSPGADA